MNYDLEGFKEIVLTKSENSESNSYFMKAMVVESMILISKYFMMIRKNMILELISL